MDRILRVTLIAATICMAGSAFADQYVTLTIGNSGDPHYGDPLSVTPVGGGSESTVAGPYPYTIVNMGTPPSSQLIPDRPSFSNPYLGFCIALTENINYGQSATFLVTTLQYDLVGENSSNAQRGQIQASNVLALIQDYVNFGGNPMNPVKGTLSDALTIAIWDAVNANNSNGILHVNGASDPNLVIGNIGVSWSYSDTAVKDANLWLSTLSSTADMTNVNSTVTTNTQYQAANVYALDNANGVQDQSLVIAFGNGPNTPVPEPRDVASLSGLSLIGLLVGGLFSIRRRRGRGGYQM